ncbi:ABC transporter permease [Rossellomorea sp. BNER]|uniref:ABC transporter permease n=1 Tax=Rossellomorea sp. BNER TaxID=2962031 RepID=UPI003AF2EAAA|nr:ABC transporter permease [Rossellomorea sp. BNER]
MMKSLLLAEMIKVKRKAVWLLVFLGPIGIVGIQGLNYGIRYDYLVKPESDVWSDLLMNINMFVPITLLLGIAIITSLNSSIEHQTNTWKQILVLPVSRKSIFFVKFLLNSLLLLLSCLLLVGGTILLGILLKFGYDFPMVAILKNSFVPFFAALPILALQLWLSIVVSNQGVALTVGILGAIVSTFFRLPEWIPYSWLSFQDGEYALNISLGILTGLLVFIIGTLHFSIKDVN